MTPAPPKPVRFADLGLRLASGLALAALALADLWLGGWWLAALAAVAAAVMLWELHRMATGDGRLAAPALLVMAGAAVIGVAATAGLGVAAGALAILAGAAAAAALSPRPARPWVAGGVIYIGLAMCFVSMLRDDVARGFPVIAWLVLVVVAADVGAYFVGRSLGGPRLWRAVSPGKTWSGAIGGLGLAVAVGIGVGHMQGWPLARTGALSAALAVASQAGDLLESAVKRRFGVKDASQLIPGHGGVMDRLDGVMGALWFLALYDFATGGVGA